MFAGTWIAIGDGSGADAEDEGACVEAVRLSRLLGRVAVVAGEGWEDWAGVTGAGGGESPDWARGRVLEPEGPEFATAGGGSREESCPPQEPPFSDACRPEPPRLKTDSSQPHCPGGPMGVGLRGGVSE